MIGAVQAGMLGIARGGDPYAANVVLLLKGETLVDEKGHTMTTEGSTIPAVSTTQKKFGTSSIYFAGASTLLTADHADFEMGAESFTVDFWLYTSATDACLFYKGNAGGTTYTFGAMYYPGATLRTFWNEAAGAVSCASNPTTGQWVHVALVKNNGSGQFYIDGTANGSAGNLADMSNNDQPFKIGSMGLPTYYHALVGYIDHFRITKGISRWTADFTPPTEADY